MLGTYRVCYQITNNKKSNNEQYHMIKRKYLMAQINSNRMNRIEHKKHILNKKKLNQIERKIIDNNIYYLYEKQEMCIRIDIQINEQVNLVFDNIQKPNLSISLSMIS